MMSRTCSLILSIALLLPLHAMAEQRTITCLGRLEPANGVVNLAGPSGGGLSGAVIKTLEVAEGDWVEKDQVVARLDSYELRKAEVARLNAILANAESEMTRQKNLAKTSSTSKIQRSINGVSKVTGRPENSLGSWNGGRRPA